MLTLVSCTFPKLVASIWDEECKGRSPDDAGVDFLSSWRNRRSLFFGSRHPTSAREGDLDQIAARICTFNIESFRNLTDLGEQEYLREHLSFLEFRRVHFLRMTVAVEYLWAAARNARIIIQLAEGAKQNATPAVFGTAERLQRNASLVCLHAFRVVPRLLLCALVPDITRHAEFIAEDYTGVVREMSMLRMLLYSDRTRTGMIAGGYAAAS